MNKKIICMVTVLLSGCAGMLPTHPIEPTKQALLSYDYGESPADYKNTVETYIKASLIDPESAQFTNYSLPKKDWLSDNEIDGKTYIGWLVCVDVNAKNRLGGYVGRKPYFLILKGNQVLYSQSDLTIKIVADGMSAPNRYTIECK